MMQQRRIRPAGVTQPGKTGKAFEAILSGAVLPLGNGVRNGGTIPKPRGLVMWVQGSRAAEVKLEVGVSEGGAGWSRTFSLTAAGVWFTAANWESVLARVETVGAEDVRIAWAWTTIEPQSTASQRLLYVETITAGTRKCPEGAVAVTPEDADNSWEFITEAAAGAPISITTPLTAATRREVIGDRYTATVANRLCWELWAP